MDVVEGREELWIWWDGGSHGYEGRGGVMDLQGKWAEVMDTQDGKGGRYWWIFKEGGRNLWIFKMQMDNTRNDLGRLSNGSAVDP